MPSGAGRVRYRRDLGLSRRSREPHRVDAAGRRELVLPLSLAAAAAGADGIIVEVHPNPDEAICDGPQALRTEDFAEYTLAVERAAALAGKALVGRASALA